MRSRLGLSAALLFLLALPLAVLIENVAGGHAEATLHLVWALGLGTLAFAVRDFRTPWWLSLLGCLAAGALAGTFVLQGISNLVPNEVLHHIAFPVLGSTPERLLVDVLIAWFAGLGLTDSHGRARLLGRSIMALVVSVELFSFAAPLFGASLYTAAPALKLVLLLPFVWLLVESTKVMPAADAAPTSAPGR